MIFNKLCKNIALGFALMIAVASPSISPVSMHIQYQQVQAGEADMAQIQLILKKLRASMSSMKDFDELEKAGMSKNDVNRMRRAMSEKIQQLSDAAVASIRRI